MNFCKRHNLFVTNTWFQQKRSAQHRWVSQNNEIKNQIDCVLVAKRYRNGVQNGKSMPGAECGSDHNPVIVKMKIRLQRVKKSKRMVKCNLRGFKTKKVRDDYRMRLDKQLQEEKCDEVDINDIWKERIDVGMEIDEIWKKLKEGITIVA